MLSVALVLAVAGVRAPDRLTAGPADQFLGALSPDGAQLYFVSDEESTTQIYAQDVARGLPVLLFDEVADVSWPRPSPDGRHLLYISYQTDAAGDLCVRELPGGGGRRCLTDEKSAEAQAMWMPDGKSIAMVTRAGLHGDYALRRIGLDGKLGEVLVGANLSTPAISPDGRFVVYVPVERGVAEVGPSFLSHASGALAVARVGGGAPAAAAFDLPGASGFPAFSLDGKWLYFAQFLNDTNLDGTIDGKDNGVLFRAPFADGKLGAPEQLTSARWSCQYPVPARDRLVATCLAQGSLDVYSLPLDGGVPPDWPPARVNDELDASTDRWEQLLLLSRRADSPEALPRMIQLHLELGEYESAAFYAKRLVTHEPTVGMVLGELAAQRKAERALARGMLSGAFVADARARLARLAQVAHPLAAVARSEIHDALAEEDRARAALESIDTRDPLVAALYAERLLSVYRDDPRFFELYRPLAEQDLRHAQAFVRELMRGAGPAERRKRAEAWLPKTDGDLPFLLELERALADLTPEKQEQVREQVFQLYRKNKEFARRKALVAATVRRAVADDNEYLLYQFADTWVSYVPRDRAERRHAETLFRDAVLERAYVEEERGKTGDARGRFYAVTLQTDALEAHAGFIEMRLAERLDPAKDYTAKPNEMPARYARAYLAARGLAAEKDPKKFDRAAAQAIVELQAIAAVAPQRPEVHQLWGYIAQQRFRRTGRRLNAVEANAHYLLALDLARESPRQRAASLDALGRLQSEVGNFAIALGWLEERAKLPYTDDRAHLSTCLALARARFHAGEGAAATADECLALAAGDLARFRPLALDRAGLYHLVEGTHAVAAERYAELWPLVADAPTRLTTQIGWAAASLGAGKPADAVAHLDAAEKLPGGRDRALLLDGLRAQAQLAAGQLPAAAAAMTRRRDGLAARLKKTEVDEDRLELASAESQLALYAYRGKAYDDSLAHIEAALRWWDGWSKNTGTPIEDVGLAILSGYAELHLWGGLPLARMRLDLPGRLQSTYDRLSKVRNPAWEPARARFEVYLTMLRLGGNR